ncbi:DUF6069 family protein [Actinomadura harenae]|uniref:Transmembrane protein n=1 Tax=Actinomadura harenae TaxID=2483351 RepID=A0A3M2LU20_9ACTN|nr:DUF6069 family protein [Actinomadura harenae]RMI40380.1 hypothetical protein EBO15_26785 [Actinomadura harenae]
MNTSLKQPLLTIAGATAAALAVWTVAVPVAGVDLTVRMGDGTGTVGPLMIVLTSVLAGLSGWILLAILRRRTPRAERAWPFVAPGVLIASFTGPSSNAVGASSTVVLILLHVVVGIILTLGLMPRRRPAIP